MELEIGNVLKPVRNLRKSLKSLPHAPSIAAVHNLRTRTRRLEAIVATLAAGDGKLARRLLKIIKAISKTAGAVRDMDVLSAKALGLLRQRHDDSVLRLLEHLRTMRIERARKLRATVSRQRKDARQLLKRFSGQLEKRYSAAQPDAIVPAAGAQPRAEAAIVLVNELRQWPAFNAQNLHSFRIKVKELIYILQLAADRDVKFVRALSKVKKRIGDWHDWQKLARIAEKVLDPVVDRTALRRVEEAGKEKLNQALAAAQTMRQRYLSSSPQAGNSKSPSAHSRPS